MGGASSSEASDDSNAYKYDIGDSDDSDNSDNSDDKSDTAIDVSHWQGSIDWFKVEKKVGLGIAKATEGKSRVDPKFETNFRGMRDADMSRGAYHFYRTDCSNEEQLKLFRDTVRCANFDSSDLLAVDFETNHGNLSKADAAKALDSFLESLEYEFMKRPVLYTSPSFWRSAIGSAHDRYNFECYPLWIVHYTSFSSPTIPDPWSDYFLWQYTDCGSVKGISGRVDMNKVNSDSL